MLLRPGFDFGERHETLTTPSQVDLPRVREGRLDAGFWAVFVPQRLLTPAGLATAEEQADEAFAAIYAMLDAFPDDLALATTPDEVRRAVDQGKHAVLIGVENGYALGGKLDNVRRFYDLGARYIGLTHTRHNDLGASSTGKARGLAQGLTEFGRAVVAEMNRLGIMVDVSHVADSTFRDVMEVSTAPPIASHSSARAVHDHPRNLTDEQLRAIAERGGVVQVNTLSEYLVDLDVDPARTRAIGEMTRKLGVPTDSQAEWLDRFFTGMGQVNAQFPPPLATLSDVADHIDHMVKVMGIDHVGVGADFDGGGGVTGMNDVSEIPNLTVELQRRGYSDDDIAKIWGGNLLRVMAEVQAVAQ
jgi:membrane dipeptidase